MVKASAISTPQLFLETHLGGHAVSWLLFNAVIPRCYLPFSVSTLHCSLENNLVEVIMTFFVTKSSKLSTKNIISKKELVFFFSLVLWGAKMSAHLPLNNSQAVNLWSSFVHYPLSSFMIHTQIYTSSVITEYNVLVNARVTIVLYLTDIHKRTESNNPDKVKLEQAIDKVKTIMTWVDNMFSCHLLATIYQMSFSFCSLDTLCSQAIKNRMHFTVKEWP